MNKVEITKEQAAFIEAYENNENGVPGWQDNLLIQHADMWHNDVEQQIKPEALCMKDLTPFELAIALTVGYEVTKTPEELIQGWYDRAAHNLKKKQGQRFENGYCNGYMRAVEDIVQLLDLNVKVEVKSGGDGKNDHSDLFR